MNHHNVALIFGIETIMEKKVTLKKRDRKLREEDFPVLLQNGNAVD